MEMRHDAAPWRPWSPSETARRLGHVAVPWGVTAGWALELFVGERWRDHEDIEVAVPAPRFDEVRSALDDLDFWVPVPGERLRPLGEMPALDSSSTQAWGLDRVAAAWRLDVFREPAEGETWICRRDPAIRMRHSELLERTADGIPFVRPEVVLLFKAKHPRDKDEEDFAAVVPRLDGTRRLWLRSALLRVHPGHRWLERLDA